jgi:hypothetical protein
MGYRWKVFGLVLTLALVSSVLATSRVSGVSGAIVQDDGSIKVGNTRYVANGDVNKEVKNDIRAKNLFGKGGDADNWVYYTADTSEQGGAGQFNIKFGICEDTLAFPPGSTITKDTVDDMRGHYWQVDWEASGFKGCDIKKSEEIFIKGAQTVDREKRDESLRKNLDQCQLMDPGDVEGCKRKVTAAFNTCYDDLSRNLPKNVPVDSNSLSQCIAAKTGYDTRDINSIVGKPADSSKRCELNGMGWVVCQLAKLLSYITDGAYKAMSLMMEVPPLDPSSNGGRELYTIWSSMRNVANVIFIILLVMVILSQVSNIGIDNYGIKRTLPRLLIAIILINISYYICAIVIDITNIAGSSVNKVLSAVAMPVNPKMGAWAVVTDVVLAGGAAVALYMNFFALVPVLFSALLAVFTALMILLARLAFIIVLVVLSPIAFALNTLPNTQKWFERWWKAFLVLAFLYPAVGVIYGGSKIAAGVISAATPTTGYMGGLFAIAALGTLTIPLFLVPILMRVGGDVLNRFTGVLNNTSGKLGLVNKAKQRVGEWSEDKEKLRQTNSLMHNSRGLHGRFHGYMNKKRQIANYHESELGGNTYRQFQSDPDVAGKIADGVAAGNYGDKRKERAHSEVLSDLTKPDRQIDGIPIELYYNQLDAATATVQDGHYDLNGLRDLAFAGTRRDGSTAGTMERAAAKRMLAKNGQLQDIHAMVDQLGTMNATERNALAQGIDESGIAAEAVHLGRSATAKMRSGGVSSHEQLYDDAIKGDKYTPETTVNQSLDSLKGINAMLERRQAAGIDNSPTHSKLGGLASSIAGARMVGGQMIGGNSDLRNAVGASHFREIEKFGQSTI